METNEAKDYKFTSINIERVNNGFILKIDERNCVATSYVDIYVFNTLEQLSEFIKDLK